MDFNNFILDFGDKAKALIAEYEKFKHLTGTQKKERVSDKLLAWAEAALKEVKINTILKAIIKFFLPKLIPDLVQVVFNLIETTIKGITK